MAQCLDVLLSNYNARPTGIIHVGANSGQEVATFRDSGIRPVILVEPLTAPFRRLVVNINGEHGFFPIQSCLSDKSGKQVEFYIASNGGQSSSYLKPARHRKVWPTVTFDHTQTMTTATLDDVFEGLVRKHSLDPKTVDYIGLDTQGSEMDILKGATRTLRHVRYVFSEVNFGNLYEADTGLYQFIQNMRDMGFDLYHLSMKRKGWGDALFMRL